MRKKMNLLLWSSLLFSNLVYIIMGHCKIDRLGNGEVELNWEINLASWLAAFATAGRSPAVLVCWRMPGAGR